MLKILKESFAKGIVTGDYPKSPAETSPNFRGRPVFDFAKWEDARPAAAVCPTAAIAFNDEAGGRTVTVDYGKCIFCGLCAEKAITMSRECELAVKHRGDLVLQAKYGLQPDGRHEKLIEVQQRPADPQKAMAEIGAELRDEIHSVLGRSLQIREVDAGSCNGCEVEIVALNNPLYDIERFGIHFVASPRHADMLLVTGPVTRNMELALKKTYDATPEPRLVVAVGACGCSGGIFGVNYASLGGVDSTVPVDVYIPGCPPRPQALLHGILLAVERLGQKRKV
jgi:Ni,Fe-hydrogenase III small subunit/formate hydrogenlyase subunit 6/NADH:ubiquinone oxidoreductase subunit I